MGIIENLEAMLAQGQDNALLRFSLGNAYLGQAKPAEAIEHLRVALQHDPRYSAAWKLLGKALAQTNQTTGAIEAYGQGITVAEAKGDKQAAKEMRVFKRRLEKAKQTKGDM